MDDSNKQLIAPSSELMNGALVTVARCMDVAVGELTVVRLTGDASTRSYFRAFAGGHSVIVSLYGCPFDEQESAATRLGMASAVDAGARLRFANDPCAHIEVTGLLLDASIPVPRILGVSGPDRIIVFEDVGDLRLQDWLCGRTDSEISAMYRRTIDLILAIQQVTHTATESNLICRELAFDQAKLGWEMNFFIDNYFGQYLGQGTGDGLVDSAKDDLLALCGEIASLPRVLTHRDYHARNLMLRGEEIFIIDHQDARMGPYSYDLASLLNDPYVSIETAVKAELLEYFIEAKNGNGPALMPADFHSQFHLMTVQRTLKAVGTYSYQSAVVHNHVYEPYIRPAIEAALSSLGALGRFNVLGRLIEGTMS